MTPARSRSPDVRPPPTAAAALLLLLALPALFPAGVAAQEAGADGDGAVLEVRPPEPVAPGSTVELALDWSYPVAGSTTGRAGWSGEDLFYIGYWYPRMAVYDDVTGWQTRPFLGTGEFYDGFGRYDVDIELPEGWLIRATGELRNREEVFPPEGGETVTRRVGVDVWLDGATTVETFVELPGGAPDGPVTVVVDPGHAFPDVDRSDNRWEGTP